MKTITVLGLNTENVDTFCWVGFFYRYHSQENQDFNRNFNSFGSGKFKNLLTELRELQVEFAWSIWFCGSYPPRRLVQEFSSCMWRIVSPKTEVGEDWRRLSPSKNSLCLLKDLSMSVNQGRNSLLDFEFEVKLILICLVSSCLLSFPVCLNNNWNFGFSSCRPIHFTKTWFIFHMDLCIPLCVRFSKKGQTPSGLNIIELELILVIHVNILFFGKGTLGFISLVLATLSVLL